MIRRFVSALILISSAYAAAVAQDLPLGTTSPTPNASSIEKITFSEVNVDGPYIAMTFDDGPHATNTPKLLEMAAQRHIKLTFFVLGECVEQNPDVLRWAYTWNDWRAGIDGLYGNGLRRGFANTQKNHPYETFNVNLLRRFQITEKTAVKIRFDVVNILDTIYELRDGSGIGVGAPQFGQRRGFYGTVAYEF